MYQPVLGRTVEHHLAFFQNQHAFAEGADGAEIVADEQHRAAVFFRHLVEGGPSDFRWNAASPTARTSSTIRISGSRNEATAKARRTYMPEE